MKRRLFRRSGPPTIQIAGRTYSQALAVIVFRCADCLGELEYHNSGLACKADREHRGFIHRNEAAQVAAEQARQLASVQAAYEIRDGQIVPIGDMIDAYHRPSANDPRP